MGFLSSLANSWVWSLGCRVEGWAGVMLGCTLLQLLDFGLAFLLLPTAAPIQIAVDRLGQVNVTKQVDKNEKDKKNWKIALLISKISRLSCCVCLSLMDEA